MRALSRALLATALACAATTALAPPCRSADSTFVHGEAGGAFETSNELYYEDTFTDTTFLGRRLFGTPETRAGAAVSAELGVLRDGGRLELRLRPDALLLDQLTRATATLTLRQRSESWRTALEPGVEYERDRSYGLDRRELRGRLATSARHPFGDGTDALELRAGGDLLDAAGTSDPYLLSHRNGRLAVGWDHTPLLGWEAQLDAGMDVRTFPDSTLRDHVEPRVGILLRRDLLGGPTLILAADGSQRGTIHSAPGSRDRFRTASGSGELQLRWGAGTMVSLELSGEALRYAEPDSAIDFDYTIGRARALLHEGGGLGWSVAAGPAGERLSAPLNPGESYSEIAGVVEIEHLGAHDWWLVSPGGGWRSYDRPETAGVYAPDALHSPFAFAEVHALADQALPGRLRVRVIADARLENHRDDSQDSRSLYFSLDLRRLF